LNVRSPLFIIHLSRHHRFHKKRLQALRVVGVGVLASGASLATLGTLEAGVAAALSVLGGTGSGWGCGRGGGSGGHRLGGRGGGHWLSSGGGGGHWLSSRAAGDGLGGGRGDWLGRRAGAAGWGSTTRRSDAREGAADRADLDVGVDDSGAGGVLLNVLRLAGVDGAGSTHYTRVGGREISWEGSVEPEHVDSVVVPDGHDEDHAAVGESLTHSLETATSP